MSTVSIKNIKPMPLSEKDILRYAGVKQPDGEISDLIQDCIREIQNKLSYRVCYTVLSVNINNDICDFGEFSVKSSHLAKNLSDCNEVLIFAATIGVEIDRMIAKYGRISPARGLIFQALGTERIESLCDHFCEAYSAENGVLLKNRFSAGYGDLPLEVQKDVFSQLDCARKIGLVLNRSLVMTPSKSVTAFVGIENRS